MKKYANRWQAVFPSMTIREWVEYAIDGERFTPHIGSRLSFYGGNR